MTTPTITAPTEGGTTGTTTTLTGTTVLAGTYVSVFLDNQYVGAVLSSADGAWSHPAASMAPGAHTVCVQANDFEGNPGAYSAQVGFTVQLSEVVAPAPPAPAIAAPAPTPAAPQVDDAVCPITDAFLPDNMKKHVDPKAPVPLRMMAAKALVPLQPADMLSVLFMLKYDAEANVREQAQKTASTLPDRIAASGFRDEDVHPPVLAWFLTLYASNDSYAEMMILNPATPDDAVATVASLCSQRTAEIIGQNQLRILRTDGIIRALAQNPAAAGALIDGVCDFAVRSGLMLDDVPQMKAAKIRLFGPEAVVQAPVQQGPTAEQIMAEFSMAEGEGQGGEATDAAPLDEQKKMSLSKRILGMNVSEKIKLATKGNKEARGILIRDSNRLVSVAVISSPRITDGEVLGQAQNKVCNEDVLRIIYSKREYLRKYAIKLALVKNPKVPQGVSMRLLATLHEHDIKSLSKDKNVPGSVQMLAKKHLDKKKEKSGGGGGH